jgi:4-amino-4-deoxychorismate lyase
MFPLLETIKVENGDLKNLSFHQERMDRSRFGFLGLMDSIDLKSTINVPEFAQQGIYKCRVVYGKTIGKVEFIPYHYRMIKTLKVVEDDEIDYSFKYSDRSPLEKLLLQKGNCDDIVIIKKGLVTDTSYANIVFFDGTKWVTPEQPLLKGTKREFLLKSGKIKSKEIKPEDIYKFSKFGLINAMLEPDLHHSLPITNITGL